MKDIWTVFHKELQEALADRSSWRGVLIQALIVVGTCGIVIPALDSSIWSARPMIMLYTVFPSTLAATMAADAFAGESERLTLEGLLATPLPDRAIYIGKLCVAVLLVIVISSLSLVAAVAIASVRDLLPTPVPWLLFVGVLYGSLAAGILTAAISVAISVRVLVARSAQQMSSLLPFVIAACLSQLFKELNVPLTWGTIVRSETAVLLVGLLGLIWGTKLFRRDKFF